MLAVRPLTTRTKLVVTFHFMAVLRFVAISFQLKLRHCGMLGLMIKVALVHAQLMLFDVLEEDVNVTL